MGLPLAGGDPVLTEGVGADDGFANGWFGLFLGHGDSVVIRMLQGKVVRLNGPVKPDVRYI